jgi:hypothetical protein
MIDAVAAFIPWQPAQRYLELQGAQQYVSGWVLNMSMKCVQYA